MLIIFLVVGGVGRLLGLALAFFRMHHGMTGHSKATPHGGVGIRRVFCFDAPRYDGQLRSMLFRDALGMSDNTGASFLSFTDGGGGVRVCFF